MTLLVAAIFPVVFFLIVIYRKDTEREPPKLVMKCFFLGCVATLPIVIVELLVGNFNNFDSPLLHSLYEAFIVAAVVEEGFKFLFLYAIIWKRKEFDQYYDGIVYAVFISLGFALVENILYVFEYGMGTAILRAILSVPGHGLFGVAMGYFFSLARFSPNGGKGLLWLSFLVPMIFHGLYDFFIMYMGESENPLIIGLSLLAFIIALIFIWRAGARYIKKHHTADKQRQQQYYY